MIMRFDNVMYWKIKYFCVFALCVVLTGNLHAHGKQGKQRQNTSNTNVSVRIVDETGKSIPKASVVVGEGMLHVEADENGSLTFKAFLEDAVTISLPGYD